MLSIALVGRRISSGPWRFQLDWTSAKSIGGDSSAYTGFSAYLRRTQRWNRVRKCFDTVYGPETRVWTSETRSWAGCFGIGPPTFVSRSFAALPFPLGWTFIQVQRMTAVSLAIGEACFHRRDLAARKLDLVGFALLWAAPPISCLSPWMNIFLQV